MLGRRVRVHPRKRPYQATRVSISSERQWRKEVIPQVQRMRQERGKQRGKRMSSKDASCKHGGTQSDWDSGVDKARRCVDQLQYRPAVWGVEDSSTTKPSTFIPWQVEILSSDPLSLGAGSHRHRQPQLLALRVLYHLDIRLRLPIVTSLPQSAQMAITLIREVTKCVA